MKKPQKKEKSDLPYGLTAVCRDCNGEVYHSLLNGNDYEQMKLIVKRDLFFCDECTSTSTPIKKLDIDKLGGSALTHGWDSLTKEVKFGDIECCCHDSIKALGEKINELIDRDVCQTE